MGRSTEYSTLQENKPENPENIKGRQQKNERTALNGKIENKEEKLILIIIEIMAGDSLRNWISGTRLPWSYSW